MLSILQVKPYLDYNIKLLLFKPYLSTISLEVVVPRPDRRKLGGSGLRVVGMLLLLVETVHADRLRVEPRHGMHLRLRMAAFAFHRRPFPVVPKPTGRGRDG